MTAPRKAHEAATFTVDYDCERRCQAEFDLTGIRIRLTIGMMLGYCAAAHKAAHKADPPVRVYSDDTGLSDILVRADVTRV